MPDTKSYLNPLSVVGAGPEGPGAGLPGLELLVLIGRALPSPTLGACRCCRQGRVGHLCGQRRISVTSSCCHCRQAEDWIQERVQRLGGPLPPGDLKDRLRHLREHQAFQTEVQAHEEVIISVIKVTASPAPKLDPRVAGGKGLRKGGSVMAGEQEEG